MGEKNKYSPTNTERNNEKKELIFIARGYENVKFTVDAGKEIPEVKKQNRAGEIIQKVVVALICIGITELAKWLLLVINSSL